MKILVSSLAMLLLGLHLPASGQPARPKITGIAHVRVYSTNLDDSTVFYGKIVGLGNGAVGCLGVSSSCFQVNDHQRVEVTSAANPPAPNFLAEVAFATDDLTQMWHYLIAHGITVGAISKGSDGAPHFELIDPEGQPLGFVQQAPKHSSTPAAGALKEQISNRLIHAGFVVRDSGAEDRFYRDLLGFRLYWRGGFKDDGSDWQAMQVPDGTDWVEYMLNISPAADHKELGVQNHFSLGVVHMTPTFERLQAHGLKTSDVPEIGRDGKMQFDIYDPDATRVEFMEFEPSQKPCCHPFTAPHPRP
jgi:catechol 2,3-dioxygenase-like lactoylglutathione lyase family enzyme